MLRYVGGAVQAADVDTAVPTVNQESLELMSTAIAKNLMAEMKLLGMFAAFDQSVSDATRDQTSYSEFLDTLLQAEADYRQERKTGYRIKAAKFTLRPAFEDIDFTASRSISKAQIKELYGMQWLAESRPVLLIGQTGVGKTFIAQATGLHACACGKSVLGSAGSGKTEISTIAAAMSASNCVGTGQPGNILMHVPLTGSCPMPLGYTVPPMIPTEV
jgi:RecG-like helicase